MVSKSSFRWVCRRLSPLLVHQHHFCVTHIFRTKLGNLSLQIHTWPEALELRWNPVIEDEAELPGDFQLDLMQNENVSSLQCVVLYNASCSNLILSRTLRKLFVGSGIFKFYMRTWLAYMLTTILGTRCQKFCWLLTGIEAAFFSLWW